MATEVILPKVDMDMATGQISRWFHREGDVVRKGEPLFEIETDKAAMEVEAPASGTLRDVTAAEGVDIAVGAAVGWIYAEGEEPGNRIVGSEGAKDRASASLPVAEAGAAGGVEPGPPRLAVADASEGKASAGERRPVRATPLARRLARERGIDLASIAGRGPSGRVQREDVEAAFDGRATLERPTEERPAARPAAAPKAGDAPLHAVQLREGSGTPVVLIHGFGSEIAGWRPFLPEMPTGTPVFGIDLAGHGGSIEVVAESLEALAQQVEETCAERGLTDAHLVGHSLGAAVAVSVASGIGIEARSLLLLAPAGLGPEIDTGFVEGFARASDERAVRRWLQHLVFDAASLSEGLIRASARGRADGRFDAPQRALASRFFAGGTQLFETRSLLRALCVPIKVVMGSDDRVIPSRHGVGLPGHVALHVFPNTGHLPHIERRAEAGRLLRELVR